MFNQTDVYERLNALPEDRDETTPIKNIIININDESNIITRIEFDSIAKFTRENLFYNLNEHISYDNSLYIISALNATFYSLEENSLLFTYKLPSNALKVSVQLFLFEEAINNKQYFDIKQK